MTQDRRPVTLFTGQWTDVPFDELVAKTSQWGFDGLELACWGDHFEIPRALAEPAFGVTTVTGFTGSPIWHRLYSFPPNDFTQIEPGYDQFAEAWSPIIDVFDAAFQS
jgi:sugar phosphate isomerase/epimerase